MNISVTNKYYGDLFRTVEQRVAAYKLYLKFNNNKWNGSMTEKLDNAYRFLYTSVNTEFIKFCADHENMNYEQYLTELLYPYDGVKSVC